MSQTMSQTMSRITVNRTGKVSSNLLFNHRPMVARTFRTNVLVTCEQKSTEVNSIIRASKKFTCVQDGCAIPIVKKRVVVLGSGWGAISIAKNFSCDNEDTELIFISPRNYMLYTPLLPSVVGGVISDTSIMEPVRNIINGKATYYEARATDVNISDKRVVCDDGDRVFEIEYDTLVCSVGSVSATFGIKGVVENCMFLKNMEDARKLRIHVNNCIERAALPCITPEERKKLLSFVIVGGGPTGVEVAAEIYDLINEDISNKLPAEIRDNVTITLVDGLNALLNSYDVDIQKYAAELFRERKIDLRFKSFVKSVSPGLVEFQTDAGMDSVEFGTCVWSAGITMHPLVSMIKNNIGDDQTSNRGLIVDDNLRVFGAPDVICIGDAAIVNGKNYPPTAQVAAQQGEYIARVINGVYNKKFSYFHKGAMAYLGRDIGVVDLPVKTPMVKFIGGMIGATIWKSYETFAQVSSRTRCMVAHDWIKTKVFGRNISN